MALPSRFERDYELVIAVRGSAVVVRPPLRVSFGVDKSIAGGLNKMQMKIYNLSPSHRADLVKDAEQIKSIPIQLSVGYKESMGVIFKGTVFKGSNSREGTDFVTSLECLDGGAQILNGFTSATVKGKAQAIEAVRATMPGIEKGKISPQQDITRPRVLVGANARLLDDLVDDGATWYIDNEQLFIIKENEVVSKYAPEVSAETGLLNTPERDQKKVTFETLMNPMLKLGGLCTLKSQSAPQMDGVYKIQSMGYSGDTYGAGWNQSVTCMPAFGYKVL